MRPCPTRPWHALVSGQGNSTVSTHTQTHARARTHSALRARHHENVPGGRPTFRVDWRLARQRLQHLGRARQSVPALTHADVQTELHDPKVAHNIAFGLLLGQREGTQVQHAQNTSQENPSQRDQACCLPSRVDAERLLTPMSSPRCTRGLLIWAFRPSQRRLLLNELIGYILYTRVANN